MAEAGWDLKLVEMTGALELDFSWSQVWFSKENGLLNIVFYTPVTLSYLILLNLQVYLSVDKLHGLHNG